MKENRLIWIILGIIAASICAALIVIFIIKHVRKNNKCCIEPYVTINDQSDEYDLEKGMPIDSALSADDKPDSLFILDKDISDLSDESKKSDLAIATTPKVGLSSRLKCKGKLDTKGIYDGHSLGSFVVTNNVKTTSDLDAADAPKAGLSSKLKCDEKIDAKGIYDGHSFNSLFDNIALRIMSDLDAATTPKAGLSSKLKCDEKIDAKGICDGHSLGSFVVTNNVKTTSDLDVATTPKVGLSSKLKCDEKIDAKGICDENFFKSLFDNIPLGIMSDLDAAATSKADAKGICDENFFKSLFDNIPLGIMSDLDVATTPKAGLSSKLKCDEKIDAKGICDENFFKSLFDKCFLEMTYVSDNRLHYIASESNTEVISDESIGADIILAIIKKISDKNVDKESCVINGKSINIKDFLSSEDKTQFILTALGREVCAKVGCECKVSLLNFIILYKNCFSTSNEKLSQLQLFKRIEDVLPSIPKDHSNSDIFDSSSLNIVTNAFSRLITKGLPDASYKNLFILFLLAIRTGTKFGDNIYHLMNIFPFCRVRHFFRSADEHDDSALDDSALEIFIKFKHLFEPFFKHKKFSQDFGVIYSIISGDGNYIFSDNKVKCASLLDDFKKDLNVIKNEAFREYIMHPDNANKQDVKHLLHSMKRDNFTANAVLSFFYHERHGRSIKSCDNTYLKDIIRSDTIICHIEWVKHHRAHLREFKYDDQHNLQKSSVISHYDVDNGDKLSSDSHADNGYKLVSCFDSSEYDSEYSDDPDDSDDSEYSDDSEGINIPELLNQYQSFVEAMIEQLESIVNFTVISDHDKISIISAMRNVVDNMSQFHHQVYFESVGAVLQRFFDINHLDKQNWFSDIMDKVDLPEDLTEIDAGFICDLYRDELNNFDEEKKKKCAKCDFDFFQMLKEIDSAVSDLFSNTSFINDVLINEVAYKIFSPKITNSFIHAGIDGRVTQINFVELLSSVATNIDAFEDKSGFFSRNDANSTVINAVNVDQLVPCTEKTVCF